MRRQKYLDAVHFFKEHAGYSIAPGESEAQGRLRSARALAKAERWAWSECITFDWEPDWSIGNHFDFFGEAYADGEPSTCEVAIARDPDGQVIASLNCIDDADANDRRVINAELALEAMPV